MELNNHVIPDRLKLITFMISIKELFYSGYHKNDLANYKEDVLEKEFLESIADSKELYKTFYKNLFNLQDTFDKDLEFFFASDPACNCIEEIIACYPGFIAIFYHRIAHILYNMNLKVCARVISEEAHKFTGIDIHPGAQIGEYFFIDHGTGIVIGETSVIGHHVKIYQGVTLGGLSLSLGQKLKNVKRHPTVGNYVTIYAGASILGGDVIIGDNVIIGANVFLTKSVENNTKVILPETKLVFKKIN